MLEVKHLKKKYGSKVVLEDISFSLKPGEITALIGLNGEGKTTVMKAIMDLTPLDGGQVLLDGQALTKDEFHRIVYIPDELAVPRSMTIQEALDFMEDFYPNHSKNRAKEIASFFNLDLSERISKLSKGNVAKVNLLLGLAVESDFVLMDEPFSGIDIFTREEIQAIFVSDLIQGRGVLVSTHDIEEVEILLDQAIILHQGTIHRSFSPEEEREATGRSVKDMMREVYQG